MITQKKNTTQSFENDFSFFRTHDGLNLHYSFVQASTPKSSVLVFVHGLNEHLGRYKNVVEFFREHHDCYLFDLRGHGRSEGRRSHVDSFDELIFDLKSFLDFVKDKNPDKKIFLIAHSMGGQIALNYLGRFGSSALCGVVTLSPNIQIAFHVGLVERKLGSLLHRCFSKVPLPNHVKPRDLSHDPQVAIDFQNDPLVNKTPTLGLGYAIIDNQDVIMECASKISLPILMLHSGQDKICDKQGSIDFFNHLASVDKTLKIYPEAFHELLNETNKAEVFADIQTWLKQHL